MTVLLGAIADDFTGATDLANTLVKQGMRAIQVIGVPAEPIDLGDAEAVVVALKSRTVAAAEAVASSLAALDWLRGLGARQILFKYCSTFDSTAEGNIGPVADALLEALETDFALVCPAFPANQRTIYQGHLFVGDQLLSDSSMKDHPLTPMRQSNLVSLMAAQSTGRVGLISYPAVSDGPSATKAAIDALRADGRSYGVIDALSDADLLTIGAAAADHRLITGGSGIALGLPENFRREGLLGAPVTAPLPAPEGRAVILSGSCSTATRAQVARAQVRWPHRRLDADSLAADAAGVQEAAAWALAQPEDTPVLLYTTADPDSVAATQARLGRDRAAALLEDTFGRIALALVDAGARRLVVAGGETSGAVVSALGVRALRIGAEIAPGVPWTETLDAPHLALALKSGNFGDEDFFATALDMLP